MSALFPLLPLPTLAAEPWLAPRVCPRLLLEGVEVGEEEGEAGRVKRPQRCRN